MMNIKVELTKNPKQKPNQNNLGFGKYFADHMFVMDYKDGKGWYNPRIVPYANLSLDPSAMVLHYGQEVFEGLKAYKSDDGSIRLFRPNKNMQRLNVSNERLCIPLIDEDFAVKAIKKLVKIDESWIPSVKDASLYIRPFIIATDSYLGVRASNEYMFIIILSPVGAYYPEGLDPVKIYVETEYVRAVKGGLGFTKAGGNYAGSIKAQNKAKMLNFTQVLWLDGVERKYIEEVGTMNVFFFINDTVVTPSLEGSILSGVTRASCIDMLKSWGIKVEERKISIDELCNVYDKGQLIEAFGTGTAAVISPIGELNFNGKAMSINNRQIGKLSQKLYDTLTGIQWGKLEDTFNWTVKV